MGGMALQLGTGLHRRASGSVSGGPAAYQQILDQATDDGWAAVYDPTNPDTRTLRDDGGDQYFSAIADGLGNLTDLVQATAANQPQLSAGTFGQLDAMLGAGDQWLRTAAFAADMAQPNFQIVVAQKDDSITGPSVVITDGIVGTKRNTLFHEGSSNTFTAFAGALLNGNATDANAHIFGALFNDASSELYQDSVLAASGDAQSNVLSGLTMLARHDDTGPWTGPVGLVLLFDGDPGATKRTAMFDLLHDLTGIPKA